jgi:hypothetical protein
MPRDGDAGLVVEAEGVGDVRCLRAAKQLLEASGVVGAMFEGLRAFGGFAVLDARSAFNDPT